MQPKKSVPSIDKLSIKHSLILEKVTFIHSKQRWMYKGPSKHTWYKVIQLQDIYILYIRPNSDLIMQMDQIDLKLSMQ